MSKTSLQTEEVPKVTEYKHTRPHIHTRIQTLVTKRNTKLM